MEVQEQHDDAASSASPPAQSQSQSSHNTPRRHRRPTRACDQCRRRKQSCRGTTAPCERCARLGKQCSLSVLERASNDAEMVVSLKKQMEELNRNFLRAQERIARLEGSQLGSPVQSTRVDNSPTLTLNNPAQVINPPTNPPPQRPVPTSSTSRYRPPIATLQALHSSSSRHEQSLLLTSDMEVSSRLDPVSRGILSMRDAERLFEIFFSACHEIAPCSSLRTQRSAADVRARSLLLFTSICLIGARYWEVDNTVLDQHKPNWLHPRYSELVSLFDAQLHELIFRPSSADFTIEVVQSLLLSIQWPALEWSSTSDTLAGLPSMKSRFNDAYAWVMIGLAIRFARHINLDKCHELPFDDPTLSEDSMSRMRIWLNLVSIDRHLTLTAGLPASLSAPPVHILRSFGSHTLAQSGDLRLAGLAELVNISQLAAVSGDDHLRSLDNITLRVINHELDEWDRRWTVILGSTNPHFREQMPHTALRWYRLALNAIPIGVILGESNTPVTSSPSPSVLSYAVEAAFSLLWQYSSEATSERPERETHLVGDQSFRMNFMALSTFMFAIDAYWITHAYAAVFLVLLYERGCIDSDLAPLQYSRVSLPPAVPETSRLHRIITFAVAMFDGVCQGASHHPATQYRNIVANALTKLDQYKAPATVLPDDGGIDEMINALMQPGQEWAFLKDLGITI